jgi:hypothetical protein
MDRDQFGSCRPPLVLCSASIRSMLVYTGSARLSLLHRLGSVFRVGSPPARFGIVFQLCSLFCKKTIRQELCFLSCSARWFSSSPEPWGHVAPPELPCVERRVLKPRGHMVAPELPCAAPELS